MWQYNELYHHGIKGQKWGVRRYQNLDGSLTSEGRKRYRTEKKELNKKRNNIARSLNEGMKDYKKNLKFAKKQFKQYKNGEGFDEYAAASAKERKKLGQDFIQKQLESHYGKQTAKALKAHYDRGKKVNAGASAGIVAASAALSVALSLIGGAPVAVLGGAIPAVVGSIAGGGAAVAATQKKYNESLDEYSEYLDRKKKK